MRDDKQDMTDVNNKSNRECPLWDPRKDSTKTGNRYLNNLHDS